MQELHDERLARVRHFPVEVEAAPVWVAVLLRRANTTADLWPRLIEMREETAALRRGRAAIERELMDNGEDRVIGDMVNALQADSAGLWKSLGGVTVPVALGLLGSALTGVGAGAYLGGVVAFLGAALLTGDPAKLRARLLRPREVVLSNLGASVTELRQSLPKAGKIWSLNERSLVETSETFTRMSRLTWV